MSILDKPADNIIPFPDHRNYGVDNKYALPLPEVKPPRPEPKVYYTLGLSNDNRVCFTMGHSTLTMNEIGVQDLIDQLEFYKDRLEDEE